MVYKHAIFMRLGINPHNGLDGLETIQQYESFIARNGAAWFSAGALSTGMSERYRCEFQDAIDYHYVLELYFALGKAGGGDGDIAYVAEVMGIETSRTSVPTPDPGLTPCQWREELRGTWLKIRNLKPAEVSTDDFTVINTGAPLADAVKGGKYHFGYVKRVGVS